VNVFTNLAGVSVVSKDGSDIVFNPSAKRDNDVDYGLPGSNGLASKLTVTATYTAYNDTSVTSQPVELVYIGQLARLWQYDLRFKARGDRGEYIPFYEFSSDDASYAKGWGKWLAQYNKGAKGKDSVTQAITVTHRVDFDQYVDTASPAYVAGVSRFPCWIIDPSTGQPANGQYVFDTNPASNPDGDPDVLIKDNTLWYQSYPGISDYAPLTEGTYTHTLTAPGIPASPTQIPNFAGNYTRKGFVWTDVAKTYGAANSSYVDPLQGNGSGLKNAKAKKDTNPVTWQVKDNY